MTRAGVIAAVLLVAAFARAANDPGIVTHTARSDDTLALLAAEYYADRNLAVFIMVENGMTHPRPLKAGERLRIPTAWKYTCVSGDSLVKLSATFLGDERRAPFLAEFNDLAKNAALAPGQDLMIPFHVRHVAQEKESLSQIAAAFYGDSKRAELLRGYNFRERDEKLLKKGDSVIVPVVDVRVRAEKLPAPDAETAQREKKRREATQAVAKALPAARESWRAGDYAAVKRDLASIELEALEPASAADVAFLLGSAYVAFGDDDSALAAYKKVLERIPDYVVEAIAWSPKIGKVWVRAGGTVKK